MSSWPEVGDLAGAMRHGSLSRMAAPQVDVLVMKHFLSGFSDADAEVILKHCREVLTSDGKILLLQVCPSDLISFNLRLHV